MTHPDRNLDGRTETHFNSAVDDLKPIGLGVALVQKLVEPLQGEIYVASSAKNTGFTVSLPVA